MLKMVLVGGFRFSFVLGSFGDCIIDWGVLLSVLL